MSLIDLETKGPDLVDGILTNWIPLITPGPASIEECSSAVYFQPSAPDQPRVLIAFDPYYGQWVDPSNKCLAKEHSQWWQQHSDGVTTDINLGPFNCPTGYTTASASTRNSLSTIIACCPSSYEFQGEIMPAGSVGQCLSPLSIGQVITAKSVTGDFTWVAVTTTVDKQQDMTGVQINGFILKRAAGLTSPASTTATTTLQITTPTSTFAVLSGISSQASTTSEITSSVSGTSSIVGNTPSAVTFAASRASSGKSGLGSSAKIGIGIGLTLSILGISCLIATFLLLRRRTKRRNAESACREVGEAPDSTIPGVGNGGSREAVPFVEAPPDSYMDVDKRLPVEMWVPPSKGG